MEKKKPAVGAALGGTAGYALGTAIHDVTRSTRALGNKAMGHETGKSSLADYVPLATSAALGGLAYKNPGKVGGALGINENQLKKMGGKNLTGALGGTVGYGAGAALRDLYKAYNKPKPHKGGGGGGGRGTSHKKKSKKRSARRR